MRLGQGRSRKASQKSWIELRKVPCVWAGGQSSPPVFCHGRRESACEEGRKGCWRLREWNKQSTEACLVGSAHGLFQSLECSRAPAHRMF